MQDDVNILIGVGGTGAKVVESALVLMAAGIGPRKVHVGLIDQDQSNGNVARTRELITTIGAFRKAWSGGKNSIDWRSDRADAVLLGSIDVEPLFESENNSLWCPEENEASLASILAPSIGGDPNRKDLFDLLFMRGEEEQDLPLGKGYRGRAHVGATALVSALIEPDSALLDRLRTLMENTNRDKVNIFVVGSAFGGTGAAGFPTLARALHRMREAKDFTNGANVTLGGMLMLPYFSFNDDKTDTQAVVTSDELLPKAQLALDYYHNLFGTERAFDQFYALGWGNLFHLGYHQAGAAEQTNPALPPELFAASAALDFYSRAAKGNQPDRTRIMVSARENLPIRWKDLPLSEEIEPKLGQFLRFAIYWRYIAEDMIDASSGLLGMSKNWIQKLTNGEKKIDADREVSSLSRLIDHVLVWAATLEKMGSRHWGEGPWNMRHFVTENENSPTEPLSQIPTLSESDALDGFDQLIRVDGGQFVARAGAALHRELKSGAIQIHNESRGLGRAVATVAKAASLRGER